MIWNSREWMFFPIEMPVDASGRGPAAIGSDAAKMTYEVWDQALKSHGAFSHLPDAINRALSLNAPHWISLADSLATGWVCPVCRCGVAPGVTRCPCGEG